MQPRQALARSSEHPPSPPRVQANRPRTRVAKEPAWPHTNGPARLCHPGREEQKTPGLGRDLPLGTEAGHPLRVQRCQGRVRELGRVADPREVEMHS